MPVPCIVLVMFHKKGTSARVILGNQSWIKIEEFAILNTEDIVASTIYPFPEDNAVKIGDRLINLPTALGELPGIPQPACILYSESDARHLCSIWEALVEYQLNRDTEDYEPEVFNSFLILVAVKLNYPDIVERAQEDGRRAVSCPTASAESLSTKLRQATEDLASALLSNKQEMVPSSMTLFAWAASKGYHAVAAALLSRIGIITTQEDVKWWYSLSNVVGTGNMKAGMLFWFHGIRGVGLVEDGTLEVAASRGDETMVDWLLLAGANVFTHGVLTAAVEGDQGAMVDKLLVAGASINSERRGGKDTALGTAAQRRNRSMVDKLLNAGANVHAGGVLCAAFIGGDEVIIETLLTAGANINSGVLRELVDRGRKGAIDRVLKAGADANTPGVMGAAVRRGDQEIFEKLLKAGAEVDSVALSYEAGRWANHAVVNMLRNASGM